MDTNLRIRDAVREAMRAQRISQAELARKLEVKPPSLAGVLSGRRSNVPQSLIDVLDALNLELTVVEKQP